jgi:Lrp/AsnC family leucine-responsive transcriptional regulator
MDTVDMALLDQLQVDASLTNQELAARVHVSPPTCLRRVQRLCRPD